MFTSAETCLCARKAGGARLGKSKDGHRKRGMAGLYVYIGMYVLREGRMRCSKRVRARMDCSERERGG